MDLGDDVREKVQRQVREYKAVCVLRRAVNTGSHQLSQRRLSFTLATATCPVTSF